jgi:hypothetical protein
MALDQRAINEFEIKSELKMEITRYAAYFALQQEIGIRGRLDACSRHSFWLSKGKCAYILTVMLVF